MVDAAPIGTPDSPLTVPLYAGRTIDVGTVEVWMEDETLLVGPVRDQAALHGILNKICDLGLPLLFLVRQDIDHQEHKSGNGRSDPARL